MVIQFCFKNKLTATETFKMLQKEHSNECLFSRKIFECYGKFCNGWESVGDDPRAGRPWTSRIPERIAKVCTALADGRHSTIRMLAKWFDIDKETIRKIITEDLGEKKLCVRFVLHVLMSEQREDRVSSCRDFLQTHKNDLEFLNKIITGDETWCFADDPESKHLVSPQSPRQRNFSCKSRT